MIKVGDYVHYANTGLCRVEEITAPGFTAADKGRLYYRLTPAETPGSTIYTSVDNRKVEMRLAMTRQEALALIDSMPELGELRIGDEKAREHCYREALGSSDCRSWVMLLHTLYRRRKARLALGRKVTSTDDHYFKTAENRLFTELALALGREKEEMDEVIRSRIGEKEPGRDGTGRD